MTEAETAYLKNKLVSASHVFQFRSPNADEVRKAQYMDIATMSNISCGGPNTLISVLQTLKDTNTYLKQQTAPWASPLRNVYVSTYVTVAQEYLDSTEGRRVCWYIACLDAAIFLVWKAPCLRPFYAQGIYP